MALSKKEQALREQRRANKPPPKRSPESQVLRAERLARRAQQIYAFAKTQPQAAIERMTALSITPEYNQAGTMYKNVAPIITAEGIKYNAVEASTRRVVSRHDLPIEAFIAVTLAHRATKTYQADGTRQPSPSAQGRVLSAKFQGLTLKSACGMLRQAYREALALEPTNAEALHQQLEWEIKLLQQEQTRLAKLAGKAKYEYVWPEGIASVPLK